MPSCRMHWIALCAVLLVVAPLLTGVEANNQVGQPLAWMAMRSFQRFEQRVQEFSRLTKMPGLAQLILGMLQLQWGGLQGLDRQRPMGLILPALVPPDQPPLIMVLPYTDKKAMLGTLRRLLPQSTIQADVWRFHEGSMQGAGRFDEKAAVLLLAQTPALLHGLDASFPADLFGSTEGGPDVVWRVDIDAAKQRHQAEWDGLLAEITQGWREIREEAQRDAASGSETALLAFVFDIMERRQRQWLTDLSRAEGRLTLASDGWVVELETRMYPGSTSAAILQAQSQQTSHVAQLFSKETAIRVASSVHLSEAWQHDLRILAALGRRAVEEKLEARAGVAPEPSAVQAASIRTSFDLLTQMLVRPHLEMAAEIRLQSPEDVDITSWIGIEKGPKKLPELLTAIQHVCATADGPVEVSRDVVQHGATSLHRLGPPVSDDAEMMPMSLFVAEEGPFLALHAGTSPMPLIHLLDRHRNPIGASPTPSTSMLRLELPVATLLTMARDKEKSSSGDEFAAIAQVLGGATTPLLVELFAEPNAAILRGVLPQDLLQRGAEAMGQQMWREIRKTLLGR